VRDACRTTVWDYSRAIGLRNRNQLCSASSSDHTYDTCVTSNLPGFLADFPLEADYRQTFGRRAGRHGNVRSQRVAPSRFEQSRMALMSRLAWQCSIGGHRVRARIRLNRWVEAEPGGRGFCRLRRSSWARQRHPQVARSCKLSLAASSTELLLDARGNRRHNVVQCHWARFEVPGPRQRPP
jgi:hypothetical protein